MKRTLLSRQILLALPFIFLVASAAAQTIATKTTLTISPNPAAVNSDVHLLATVSPQQSSTFVPGGSVTFADTNGNTYSAPVVNLTASLILDLPQGVYTYAATYSGDPNFTGSTSTPVVLTVTPGTTTTISSTPNPALFGQSVAVTATVSPSTALGKVSFYNRATFLGVAPLVNGTATLASTTLASGLRSLTAFYSGDVNDLASSSAILYEGILAKPGIGFSSPKVLSAGTTPQNSAVGDFNGDGYMDFAVSNSGSNNVSVFLGNGNGTFQSPVTIATDVAPTALIAGDLNGDGKTDLVVSVTNGFDFLAGNGNGTFQPAVIDSVGNSFAALAIVDLNRDGNADLVGSKAGGNGISVLIGNGDGTFQTPVSYATGAHPIGLAVNDFNGDNNPDVVVANSVGVSVLLGNGDGTLGTAANYPAGNGPVAIAIKDLNGDGNIDLAVANATDGTVSILLGRGNGTFVSSGSFPVGANPTSVASSDFNGDSRPDLVISNSTFTIGSNVNVLLGNGDGTFGAAVGYTADGAPQSISVGEFNGDGEADVLVVSPTTNTASVLLNGFASLSLGAGNAQSTPVFTTFAQNLSVTAYSFGAPVANIPVTFTAPSSGPSGFFTGTGAVTTVITGSTGVATAPAFTANGSAGTNPVTVTAGGNVLTFSLSNVSQPCTFSVSPSSLTVDANGGAATFNVTASGPTCLWSAASPSSFIQVGLNSFTGSGSVNILIPQNSTGTELSGTLYVAGLAVPVTVQGTAQIFQDVPPTAYYFDAVNNLKLRGITSGCTPVDYCPTDSITRAQMAIFIVRSVYGSDNFTYNLTPYFTDVPTDAFGFAWIQKLYELGITTGCAPTLYCPDDSVLREQMAVFIIRARYGATTEFTFPTTPIFTDVPNTNFAFDWIQRMSIDGITLGCTPTTYCPINAVTRGDMALFIMRGMFNEFLPAGEPVIATVTPNTIVRGVTTNVTVTGTNTAFAQGSTILYPIGGLAASNLTVTSPTLFTVDLTADVSMTPQPYSLYVITGAQEAVLPNGLIIQ